MISKIKKYALRILMMLCAIGIMWLLSFIPVGILNVIAAIVWGLCILTMLYLCFLYLKNVRKAMVILLAFVLTSSAWAGSLEECNVYDRTSPEQGNFCRYELMSSQLGEPLCRYIRTFDPVKVKQGEAEREMREYVNNASKVVQGYNILTEEYRSGLADSCHLVTTEEDRQKSIEERRRILSNNNSAICCAWAMESLFQIYSATNGERLIETVPMMMANEKMQCWPCDVIYLLITLANTLAYRSAPTMAAVALFFLKWFFIFWIVLKVGALFLGRNFNGKAYNASQFIRELFARGILVMLAALILTDTAAQLDDKTVTNMTQINVTRQETFLDKAYQEVINPPFEMIAGLGIEMARALINGEQSFYANVASAAGVYGVAMEQTDYCSQPKGCREKGDTGCWLGDSPMYQYATRGGASGSDYMLDVTSQGRAIADGTTRSLLCLTQMAFQGLAPISAAGSIIATYSIVNSLTLPWPLNGVFPMLPELLYGLLLMILCWLLGVAVAFRLIDIMIRVAMMIMLCPIFIVAAVFPATRDKAKIALIFFVSAVMGFVEVALAVGATVPCFYHAITRKGKERELIEAMVAPSSTEYVPNLYAQFARDGGFVEDMKFFLYICVAAWMGVKLLESVEKFFEQIFDLNNIGQIGAPKDANGNPTGTMTAGATSVRAFVGDTFDKMKEVRKKGRILAKGFAPGLEKTKLGRGLQSASSYTGRKYVEGKTALKNSRLGRGTAATARKVSTGYTALKNFVRNNRLTRGIKTLAQNTKVGRAATFLVNNKLTRGIWRVAKQVPSHVKEQTKQSVHDFFHPPK